MNPAAASTCLRINREFYERFAGPYAASRIALSPGIRRALAGLQGRRSLLDLGCGDGRVGRVLASGRVAGAVERYVGLDASSGLLQRSACSRHGFTVHRADLVGDRWWELPELAKAPFEAAVCLAVLHHIPGEAARLRFLRRAFGLLAGEGRLVLSVWRFLHLPRLRRKIAPWSEVGLEESAVDRGDLLVDWRSGGRGLRYVHSFEEAELDELCRRAGGEIVEAFVSDGETGDLARYLVLTPSPPAGGTRRRVRRRPRTGG